MVEFGILPAVGRMAASTVRSELALVSIIFRVTGIAGLRCALEDIVHVAIIASYSGMRAGQFESRFRMVERGFLPIVGCVAACAICTKFSLMRIIFSMAGIAICPGSLEIGQH